MGIDWAAVFVPDRPITETILRGTLTYLGAILILRLVLKRQAGSFGLGDMLLIVMIADASQNGMAGDSHSWPNAFLLVATLVLWNFALDWASFHSKGFRKLLEPGSTPLIRDGVPIVGNLRRERITTDELRAALRVEGIDDVRKVREARLESDGALSVIPDDGHRGTHDPAPAPRPGPSAADLDLPDDPETEDAIREFLEAARRLNERIAVHERDAAASEERARRARELLSRHGVVTRARKGRRAPRKGGRGPDGATAPGLLGPATERVEDRDRGIAPTAETQRQHSDE